MRPPTATELLDLWERSLDCPGPHRAIALVALLRPELTLQELGGLTVGQREALLMRLGEHLFGPQMLCIAVCPACSTKLAPTLGPADLRVEQEPAAPSSALSVEGYCISFRLPVAADLIGLPQEIEPARL